MAITRASFDLDGCVIPFWNRTDEIFETAYCTVGKNVPFSHYGPKRPDDVWSNTRNSYTWNFDFFQKNIYFRPNKDYEVCRSTYICPKAPQIKKNEKSSIFRNPGIWPSNIEFFGWKPISCCSQGCADHFIFLQTPKKLKNSRVISIFSRKRDFILFRHSSPIVFIKFWHFWVGGLSKWWPLRCWPFSFFTDPKKVEKWLSYGHFEEIQSFLLVMTIFAHSAYDKL